MKPERGLAIGVFDLFHVGHLRYLQYARQRCRHLTVAVTPDHIAEQVKGRRPVVPQQQRLEIVVSLGFVDRAWLLPSSTEDTQSAAIWINEWEIQHVIAGGGWRGSARWGRLTPELASYGVTVEFAPHTDDVSTTQLIEAIRQRFE